MIRLILKIYLYLQLQWTHSWFQILIENWLMIRLNVWNAYPCAQKHGSEYMVHIFHWIERHSIWVIRFCCKNDELWKFALIFNSNKYYSISHADVTFQRIMISPSSTFTMVMPNRRCSQPMFWWHGKKLLVSEQCNSDQTTFFQVYYMSNGG